MATIDELVLQEEAEPGADGAVSGSWRVYGQTRAYVWRTDVVHLNGAVGCQFIKGLFKSLVMATKASNAIPAGAGEGPVFTHGLVHQMT
jgi:hypothetical protein